MVYIVAAGGGAGAWGRGGGDDVLRKRDAKLAAIDAFLAASGLRVLLLAGEASIGKTALWEAGRLRAREHACRVLSARPVEAEAVLGYAALADLFAGLDRDVAGVLPGPQRHALQVALLRGVLRTMAWAAYLERCSKTPGQLEPVNWSR